MENMENTDRMAATPLPHHHRNLTVHTRHMARTNVKPKLPQHQRPILKLHRPTMALIPVSNVTSSTKKCCILHNILDYGTYGKYTNYPPPPPPPKSYSPYASYGTYRREAEAEPAPAPEADPEAAPTDYGTYPSKYSPSKPSAL